METLTRVCEIPSTGRSSRSSQSRWTLFPWRRCFAPANGWGLFWCWQDEGQAEVFRESYLKELTQHMNNESNLSALNPGCVPGGSTPAGFILKRQSLIFSCGTNKSQKSLPSRAAEYRWHSFFLYSSQEIPFFPRLQSVSLFLVSKSVSLFCVSLLTIGPH